MRQSLVVAILALACLSISCQRATKTGYVDNVKLYNEFELKKELETTFQEMRMENQNSLDSLKRELRVLAEYLDTQKEQDPEKVIRFNNVRQEFLETQESLEMREQELSEEYTNQVWLHINDYVQAYAKEEGYDYVLGGTGQGNVMYAEEDLDITEDLIAFINKKYRDES